MGSLSAMNVIWSDEDDMDSWKYDALVLPVKNLSVVAILSVFHAVETALWLRVER